jgi:hypothetical protein
VLRPNPQAMVTALQRGRGGGPDLTVRAVIVDDQRPGPTNAGDWPPQMLSLTPIGVLGTGDDGSSWFGARRLGSEVATATPGGEA